VKIIGKIENENVISNGYLSKQKTELFINTTAKPVLKVVSNANTILHDSRTNEETAFLALKMILKGMNLRSYSRNLRY
jgi:hypothetical protein